MKVRKQTITDLRVVLTVLEHGASREMIYGSVSCLEEIAKSLRKQASADFCRSNPIKETEAVS